MRKLVRDIANAVRKLGGSDVSITEGGRHTRVNFTDRAGNRRSIALHRGGAVSSRYVAMLRSQLRRKV